MDNKQYLETLINSYTVQKSITSLKEYSYKKNKVQNTMFNQHGITNFFMLSFITLLAETLFLLISLAIY